LTSNLCRESRSEQAFRPVCSRFWPKRSGSSKNPPGSGCKRYIGAHAQA